MAPDSVQSFPLRAVALLSISFSNEMPTLADRGQGKILSPLRAKVHSDLLDWVTVTRGRQMWSGEGRCQARPFLWPPWGFPKEG